MTSQHLILAAISLGVCIFGTIIGAGGGFLLMPILLFVFGGKMDPRELTFISLFAVCVNAMSGTWGYLRLGRLDLRSGILFGACTIPTAYIGRMLVSGMPTEKFAPIFGGFLILVALFLLRQLCKKGGDEAAEPKPHWVRRKVVDASQLEFEFAYNQRVGMGASVVVGFVSSFFGIGGGIIHVPIMTQILNFPVHIATATSIFVLFISSLTGVLRDVIIRKGDVPIGLAVAAGVGAFVGAQIGTRLSKKVSGRKILFLLVIALILAGGKLAVEPLFKDAPAEGETVVEPAVEP